MFIFLGGCKHRVAFIMWLHRRSEEPSPTEVTSYWKKSVLSSAGIAPIAVSAVSSRNPSEEYNIPTSSATESFRSDILNQCSGKAVCRVFSDNVNVYDMHKLVQGCETFEQFLSVLERNLTEDNVKAVEVQTRGQAESDKWHIAHYGRVTASKFYSVCHCKTAEGSLVNSILGGKMVENKAMKRGSLLEDEIFKMVKTKFLDMKKCGLFLNKKYPLFGASPDGIGDKYVLEIKCPSSTKTWENYLKDGKVMPKYLFQIMLQMAITGKKKGYFVVADPAFEKNSEITITEVDFDEKLIRENVDKSIEFYQKYIFPHLL